MGKPVLLSENGVGMVPEPGSPVTLMGILGHRICHSKSQVTMRESSMSIVLQGLLDRLRAGDLQARDELIGHAYDRLVVLSRRMLGRYSRLRAWEQTDDVAQNAMMRLRTALEKVQPASVREFIGLASVQIRRELMDLTRHHFGRERDKDSPDEPDSAPKRQAPKVFSQQGSADNEGQVLSSQDPGSDTYDPKDLAMWREFHEKVQALPEQEREVVDLLWYQEMSQEEAADLLEVDKSTVKRRWRAARMKLHEALKGWLPVEEKRSDELPT